MGGRMYSMGDESIVISLPGILLEKIEGKIKTGNYSSVSSYIEEVIKEIFTAEEMEVDVYSQEEREEKKKKLKELGYLD
jgi:Arc/MetJ-type ribon-helix-helix transcriptional regulator